MDFRGLGCSASLSIQNPRIRLEKSDRIIRFEQRLRLMTLLTEPLRSRIPELTESQLIAIRFACDAEVPTWVESALASKLSRADIKKAIQSWRPDYWRI